MKVNAVLMHWRGFLRNMFLTRHYSAIYFAHIIIFVVHGFNGRKSCSDVQANSPLQHACQRT